jgi:hypothetical protein
LSLMHTVLSLSPVYGHFDHQLWYLAPGQQYMT